MASKRAAETPDETIRRLEQSKTRTAKKRAAETRDETIRRLEQMQGMRRSQLANNANNMYVSIKAGIMQLLKTVWQSRSVTYMYMYMHVRTLYDTAICYGPFLAPAFWLSGSLDTLQTQTSLHTYTVHISWPWFIHTCTCTCMHVT